MSLSPAQSFSPDFDEVCGLESVVSSPPTLVISVSGIAESVVAFMLFVVFELENVLSISSILPVFRFSGTGVSDEK